MFDSIDTDKDGNVSEEELTTLRLPKFLTAELFMKQRAVTLDTFLAFATKHQRDLDHLFKRRKQQQQAEQEAEKRLKAKLSHGRTSDEVAIAKGTAAVREITKGLDEEARQRKKHKMPPEVVKAKEIVAKYEESLKTMPRTQKRDGGKMPPPPTKQSA